VGAFEDDGRKKARPSGVFKKRRRENMVERKVSCYQTQERSEEMRPSSGNEGGGGKNKTFPVLGWSGSGGGLVQTAEGGGGGGDGGARKTGDNHEGRGGKHIGFLAHLRKKMGK